MTEDQKATVLSSFKAWQEEKEQKKLCGENMKEHIERVAREVLASDPEDKGEMKVCKKRATKLFAYMDSEDKDDGDSPYQLIQIIEELEIK